jgi:hypothetical protein
MSAVCLANLVRELDESKKVTGRVGYPLNATRQRQSGVKLAMTKSGRRYHKNLRTFCGRNGLRAGMIERGSACAGARNSTFRPSP